MGSIADLYATVRADMSRFGDELGVGLKKEADKGAKTFAATFSMRMSQIVKGGVGLGVGLGAFNLVKNAIGDVVSGLGDAVDAANEEAAAIAQLNTAIEENDTAWDGNIGRVEGVINARQRLGFADDEQRDSLRALVSVTKDVNAALDLQRTAMDLARLKGIDLKTATELLGKVYAGNLGTLSRYGIVLKKGATATEAIAEIQKRAAGQAETWADENVGAAKRAEIAWGNVQENIGGVFTDLQRGFDDLSTFAAEGINDLFPGPGSELLAERLDAILIKSQDAGEAQTRVIDIINDGLRSLNIDLLPTMTRYNRIWGEVEEQAREAGLSFTDVTGAITKLDDAFGLAGFEGEDKLKATDAVIREIVHSMSMANEGTKKLTGSTDALASAASRAEAEQRATARALLVFRDNADRARAEARELADDIDLAKGSFKDFWQSVREEQRRVRFFIRNPEKLREEEQRITGRLKHLEDQKAKLQADGIQKRDRLALAAIDALIRKLRAKQDEFRALGIVYGNAVETGTEQAFDPHLAPPPPPVPTGGRRGGGRRGQQHGGPVYAGVPYVVGEARRELFVPNVDGRIVPTVQPMAASGDTYNIPIAVHGLPMQARTPMDVVYAVRRAARLGIMPARRTTAWSR